MIARLVRIVATFAVVSAAYWVYAHTAVPLIEPPPRKRAPTSLTEEDLNNARSRTSRYHDLFARHFPAGHWALGTPKVLVIDHQGEAGASSNSPQGMLLFQEWGPPARRPGEPDNHQLELKPCAMLFFSEPSASDPTAPGEVLVLDAPQGMVLQFDEDFDLASVELGRFKSGQLVGQVTITSSMDPNDPNDDLVIETNNVFFNENRIWTASNVQFRAGPNHGQGTDMEIRLLTTSDGTAGTSRAAIRGVQSFELAHDVKMVLEVGDDSLSPGADVEKSPAHVGTTKKLTHVEITCQGPFRFDIPRRIATFEDSVDVVRINPEGLGDTMTCELLSVLFTDQASPQTSDANPAAGRLAAFQPYLFEAQGDPVVVRLPKTDSVIRALLIRYELGPDGGLGTLKADGPGTMSSLPGDNPAERFEGRWGQKLILQPDQGQHVLWLTGRPELKMTGNGTLIADEFLLWLVQPREDAAAAATRASPRLLPDRLLANGNVQLSSPSLAGAVDRLEVWFEYALHQPVAFVPTEGAAQQSPFAARAESDRSYAVTGRLLQANIVVRDRKPEPAHLTVEGDAHFRETSTPEPGETPLDVRGDRLVVDRANPAATQITVVGAPAHVEASGLTADGGHIALDQGANQLKINGPGRITMPIPADQFADTLLGGSASGGANPRADRVDGPPQILTVDWQRQMHFDGRTIRFLDSVVAHTDEFILRTQDLAVILTRDIRFDDAQKDRTTGGSPLAGADVEQIVSTGGVVIDHRGTDHRGQPTREHIEARDLSIHLVSGAIRAEGPGLIESVRFGNGNPLARLRTTGVDQNANGQPPETGLKYLRVDFQQQADGNLHDREITFRGTVQATYGPINDWDQRLDIDSPSGLGPDGMLLTSETLTVIQAPAANQSTRPLELIAQGNATAEGTVEGREFTARAPRMTYAEAKDLIVMEGTLHVDAQLWLETPLGNPGPDASALRILFWPTRNKIQVEDSHHFDLSGLGTPSSR